MLLGRADVDLPAYQCTAKAVLGREPQWDFGGLRGESLTPISGPGICPGDFPATRWSALFHGAPDMDGTLYYCAKPHVPGTPQAVLYGGAYSRGGVDGTQSWLNPATGFATCPNGFTSTRVQGSFHPNGHLRDHAVVMCSRGNESFTTP
jgi:hypothetical protein